MIRSVSVWGRSSVAPPGTCESGVNLPESSAAAAVTSLNVEPGGSTSSIARLFNGLSLSSSSRCLALPTPLKSWLASLFGL